MNFARLLLPALALGLCACTVPPSPPPQPLAQQSRYSEPRPGMEQSSATSSQPAMGQPGSPGADPREEYRTGYDVAHRDATYGYPSDPTRAYARFGHGLENAFQDGYADGFAGRPARY